MGTLTGFGGEFDSQGLPFFGTVKPTLPPGTRTPLPRWLRVMGTLAGLAATACAGAPTREALPPLRVGAATNHPPYSERVQGLFVGVDIDLMRDFAKSIDRTLVLEAIDWPTLVTDVSSGRVDMAVGGIHVTPARQAAAAFSNPYVHVRNAALVRCSDVTRFVTLSDVNHDGVRILVPRGTASEEYLPEDIQNATLTTVATPTEAYARVASGADNVVFTDGPLAQFRASADPRLCVGLLGASLGTSSVAVLTARDSSLLQNVNEWVARRQADGLIQAVFGSHSVPQSAIDL